MRSATILLALVLAFIITGCAGPERKLGRGFNNMVELARMGEMRRSIEQTYLWEGPDSAYTTGVIRGFNRTMVRTALGVYEVATFPLPPYGPLLTTTNRVYPDFAVANLRYPFGGIVIPEKSVYPENYKPQIISDSLFSTDTSMGFSGGDIAPMIPGSRFRIFDN